MKKLLDQHKIVANENILSSVLDGEKIVEKGTTLDYVGSQLSWDYYRAPNGLTVILMGYRDKQREKVSFIYN